ncbi:hypothetical protein EX30DRAFT_360565 [Ascodesmis nigricans]|uniref:Uncharacterized protein n=1 Tax=Ascodesmis nigricans TaxID=341454 RepID=A0A4S2N5K3_9PEZI|nr:hypothetical protein EX30DRAFT_360565 [Ascodesmis nigricans]
MLSTLASALPTAHPSAPLGPDSIDSAQPTPLPSPPAQEPSQPPTTIRKDADQGTQTDRIDERIPRSVTRQSPIRNEAAQTVAERADTMSAGRQRAFSDSDRYYSHASQHILHQAEPSSLPSYPSSGLTHPESAGAAAALFAQRSTSPVDVWRPSPTSTAGAAASMAHAKRFSPEPIVSRDTTGLGATVSSMDNEGSYVLSKQAKRSSLTGALEAMSQSNNRRRRDSSPGVIEANEIGHIVSRSPPGIPDRKASLGKISSLSGNGTLQQAAASETERQAARDENAGLRAATISMARYGESNGVPSSRPVSTVSDRPPRYPHLEEAARRVAQQRLARMGYDPNTIGTRSRSRTLDSSIPELHATAVSAEMESLDVAGRKKRGDDALLLMTVAKRNVQQRMVRQDQEISEKKGIIHRKDWDDIARNIAEKKLEAMMQSPESDSKVDIGGGRYVFREDVNKAAEKNVRPVLDEIDREATEKRWAEEELKEKHLAEKKDKENQKRVAALRKAQEKETKKELKKTKALEKKLQKEGKQPQKAPGQSPVPEPLVTPAATPISEVGRDQARKISMRDELAAGPPGPPARQQTEPQPNPESTVATLSPARRLLSPRRSETMPLKNKQEPELPRTTHGRSASISFAGLRGHLRRASRTFSSKNPPKDTASLKGPEVEPEVGTGPIRRTTMPLSNGAPTGPQSKTEKSAVRKPSLFNKLRRNFGGSARDYLRGERSPAHSPAHSIRSHQRPQSQPAPVVLNYPRPPSGNRSVPTRPQIQTPSTNRPPSEALPLSSSVPPIQESSNVPAPVDEPTPSNDTQTSSSDADDIAHGRNSLFNTLSANAASIRRSLSKRSRRKSSTPGGLDTHPEIVSPITDEAGSARNWDTGASNVSAITPSTHTPNHSFVVSSTSPSTHFTAPQASTASDVAMKPSDQDAASELMNRERRKSSGAGSVTKGKAPVILNRLRGASFGKKEKGKKIDGEVDEERARRLRVITGTGTVGRQESRFQEDL